MTPTELCALAQRINAAVPGLVYPIELPNEATASEEDAVFYTEEAASMMLGWVYAAFMRYSAKDYEALLNGDGEERHRLAGVIAVLEESKNTLRSFLLTQLPEAA